MEADLASGTDFGLFDLFKAFQPGPESGFGFGWAKVVERWSKAIFGFEAAEVFLRGGFSRQHFASGFCSFNFSVALRSTEKLVPRCFF